MVSQSLLFTIIVPVYQTEKYLTKCIESVLTQSYQNWELLLIDDGSPDNSGVICDSYSQIDSRIRVFHKVNAGVSAARNLGLENSQGDYVLFLDSDDYLDENAIEICRDYIIKGNLDLFQFSIRGVTEDYKETPQTTIRRKSTEVLDCQQYLKKGELMVCAGGSCIRQSIIQENKIRFNEKVRLAEDQMFILSCISKSRRIQFLDKSLYNYLYVNSPYSYRGKTTEILNTISVFNTYVKEYPEVEDYINFQIIQFVVRLIKNNDIKYHEIKKAMNYKKISFHKNLTFGGKCFCVLSIFNFYMACFILHYLFKFKNINRE